MRIMNVARLARTIAAALSFLGAISTAHAERSEGETRLRDLLRQTTIELRDAQSQNAELRAQIEELHARAALAAAQPPKISKPGVDAGALRLAQRDATELRATLEKLRGMLDERDRALAQMKQSYEDAEQLASTRAADVTRLEGEQQVFTKRVEACEQDNAELVSIAREVLDRYRDKGVWDALRDAEPLTGLSRVKLETLVQRYHSRIVDLQTPALPPAQAVQPAR